MNQPGMTLLELVVALAITTAILAAGYGALAGTLDASKQHDLVTPRTQRALAVRQTLVDLLTSTYSTPDEDDPGFTVIPNGADDSRLSFPVTTVPWLSHERGMVELYIDGSEQTPERGLVLKFQGISGLSFTRELSPWIDRIAARVLVNEAAAIEWREAWASSVHLPLAIELRLSAGDSIAPAVEVPLLIPLVAR